MEEKILKKGAIFLKSLEIRKVFFVFFHNYPAVFLLLKSEIIIIKIKKHETSGKNIGHQNCQRTGKLLESE
jgi:hypothetical protein